LSFLKSNFSCISKGLSQFKISIKSLRVFTAITSIQGIIEASRELSTGTKILLNHFSFAHIAIGRTESTFLSFQSRANSHTKIESSTKLS